MWSKFGRRGDVGQTESIKPKHSIQWLAGRGGSTCGTE